MSSGSRTVLEIFLFVLFVSLFTFAAYFTCTYFNGATLAGVSGLSIQIWTDRFIVLVKMSCALTTVCLLIWYLLTKAVFKVQSSADWNRRPIWSVLFVIVFVGILFITNVCANAFLEIKINAFVNVIFLLCFVVGGYWLTSIVITPSRFKSSPLGASLFRR